MSDLVCDVITWCVWSWDTGKISAWKKHVWKPEKKEKM